MSEQKSTYDGYQPKIEKGYQPSKSDSKPKAGHQPTTVGSGSNNPAPPKKE